MKKVITFLIIATGIIGLILLTKESEPVNPAKHESLFIANEIDPSGTTQGKGWPMPDKSFYLSEIELIEKNGGGDLFVFNLSNSIPVPLSLHIEPILSEPDIYQGGEEDVKRVRQANIKARQINDLNKSTFLEKLDGFILNFKPTKPEDYTYVNANIMAVIKTLNLPAILGSECYLLIYSDLLNETPYSKPAPMDSSLVKQLNSSNVKIAICSYVKNRATENIKGIPISSYQDFISVLTIKK
ncbi:MAG: hypothetical protein NTX61_03185 [Bacteroidetes bacterium]|nr:hypothetical protein [Bacteroidota bacterium]